MFPRESLSLTFFGTGSQYNSSRSQSGIGFSIGAGTNSQRNWLFDCGDSTLRAMKNHDDTFKINNIEKIFITHNHIDHSSGLPAVLSVLSSLSLQKKVSRIDVYGPPHLATMIMHTLFYSQTSIVTPIYFHELLSTGDKPDNISDISIENVSYDFIYPDDDGFWTCFSDVFGIMRAGSLQHGIPCRGYCYKHYYHPGNPLLGHRKLTVFGDTCNSESIKPLVENSTVLVHESTYGPILSDMDRKFLNGNLSTWRSTQNMALTDDKYKKKWDKVTEKAKKWNHSTVEMAGKFAHSVRAENLILTHIGGMYDAKSDKTLKNIQYLFEEQARLHFPGKVHVAYDGFVLHF